MRNDADVYSVKRGDTAPPLRAQLLDGRGKPIPLDATLGDVVRLAMQPAPGEAGTSHKEVCVIEDGPRGKVRFDWLGATTAEPGLFRAEFEITFASGAVQTVPSDDWLRIEVIADLRIEVIADLG